MSPVILPTSLSASLSRSTFNVGAYPGETYDNYKILSDTYNVAYSSVAIQTEIKGTKLELPSAKGSYLFNGNYLHFDEMYSTVADLSSVCHIVISGNFSGCQYRVYRNGTLSPRFRCVHIPRPGSGPVGTEAYVEKMDYYAARSGWELVQSIDTKGYVNKDGVTGVCMVTELFPNSHIHSVLLCLSKTNQILKRKLFVAQV